MFENWTDALKFLAVSVTAGVVTALAVQFTTGYLEQKAVAAARAEMEKIMIAAATQPPTSPAAANIPPPKAQTFEPFIATDGKHLISDGSGIGYVGVIP